MWECLRHGWFLIDRARVWTSCVAFVYDAMLTMTTTAIAELLFRMAVSMTVNGRNGTIRI